MSYLGTAILACHWKFLWPCSIIIILASYFVILLFSYVAQFYLTMCKRRHKPTLISCNFLQGSSWYMLRVVFWTVKYNFDSFSFNTLRVQNVISTRETGSHCLCVELYIIVNEKPIPRQSRNTMLWCSLLIFSVSKRPSSIVGFIRKCSTLIIIIHSESYLVLYANDTNHRFFTTRIH